MFVVLLRTVRDFALDWRSGALNSSKMQEGAGCCVPCVTALFLLLGRGRRLLTNPLSGTGLNHRNAARFRENAKITPGCGTPGSCNTLVRQELSRPTERRAHAKDRTYPCSRCRACASRCLNLSG